MQRILIADDDSAIRGMLRDYLEGEGFDVDEAATGTEVLTALDGEGAPDLVLMDVRMPDKSGIDVLREVSASRDGQLPLIIMTAYGTANVAIEAMQLGAYDYITKPFSMEELQMRIKAILKRTEKAQEEEPPSEYRIGRYSFNPTLQQLSMDGKIQRLTTRESELLQLLCLHKNDLLERNFALRSIWMSDQLESGRSMDVYITKLRKYLSADPEIEILNVHGKGFRLVDASQGD